MTDNFDNFTPERWEELADELSGKAKKSHEDKEESFQRCDTDGALTQWGLGLNARLKERQADIARCHGYSPFIGLYQGERRVKAKMISTQYGISWLLHDDEKEIISARGKKFLPTGKNSRILKDLGLSEFWEMAKAWACLESNGYGLSGSCWVETYRRGDKWGLDSILNTEEER